MLLRANVWHSKARSAAGSRLASGARAAGNRIDLRAALKRLETGAAAVSGRRPTAGPIIDPQRPFWARVSSQRSDIN